MITITPQGRVYLCKTPLENDYKNQLTFANATAQRNYFNSKVVKNLSDEDFTYIKKDNVIKIGLPIDEIIDCNYLFYQNTGFTTKYYYCFITDMEYINENCTAVTIETDVYQTYMFQIVKKPCFVEREHVNDDTLGLHTVPENLDTGEYVINSVTTFDEYATDYLIVAGVTKLPKEIYDDILANNRIPTKVYNGIYSGLYYITFQTISDMTLFLMVMDGQGIGDGVYDLFLVPKSITTITSWTNKTCSATLTIDTWSYTISPILSYAFIPNSQTESVIKLEQTITRNNNLNGYTPKNNKMFTREFNYMYVTNNAGQDTTYAYEDFYNNTVKFSVKGAVCPGCSIRLIPKNYKLLNQDASQDDICNPYGLTGAKYPVCSWNSDSYTNWITQQGVNTMNNLGEAALGFGIGAAINPTAAVASVVPSAVSALMEERKAKQFYPIQAKGNANAGDVVYSMGWNQFVLFQMSCRYEYAKRIDDYMSAYGYKVNTFKVPNTEGRTNWNYVKTVDCNFEGDIPQLYLNKIKDIFNKGITLWHNASTMLDYSQSNNIVS